MEEKTIKTKLSSGRYFLCICAGISIFLLTASAVFALFISLGGPDQTVQPVVASILATVSGAIQTIIGFYFGQNVSKG